MRIFFFPKKHEEKSSSRPFLTHSGGEQETNYYFRMASDPLQRASVVVISNRLG